MTLSNLLERMQSHQADLTASERRIAIWLGEDVSKVAFKTVSQFANESGVSEATVIRFARKLQYENYLELQKDVQDELKSQFSLSDKLQKSLIADDGKAFLAKAYQLEAKNLYETFAAISEETFDAGVQAVATSRRVAIVGFRASYGVAAYLSFALNLLRSGVVQIRLSLDNVHDQLLDFTDEDILIAFSLSRPARKTIEVVREAKTISGMTILAVTNGHFSPIATYADYLFVTSTKGAFNSYTSVMSVCHTLVEAVAIALRESAQTRLLALDERNSEDVFLD